MKNILLWGIGGVLGALLLFAAGVTLYGSRLPTEGSFVRSMQLSQPPEAVYAVLADFAGHPAWRPDVKRFERADASNDKAWRITDQHGISKNVMVETLEPPRRIVLRIVDEQSPASVTWEFTVGGIPGGSLVALRERSTLPSAFFRGVSKLFFGTKFADDCLLHLARKFGQEAVIQ
jgi:uncharacterized protein YndB with AHSA1/START domain